MCGRYVMFSTTETIVDRASRLLDEPVGVIGDGPGAPCWNIAPTHTVAVLRRYNDRVTLGPATWGYQAPWKKGAVLFNARGETVFDKASFRGSQPCLFVMDGWYEWKDRQPHFVSSRDGEPMVVAGLCRPSQVGDGQDARLEATMVTTASRQPVAWLHDRMPRLLGDEAGAWLDGDGGGDGGGDGDPALRALASGSPSASVLDALTTREADRRVGSVSVDGPELIGGGPR